MRGAIPPLPQYAFMAECLVKHRNNFTFYFFTIIKYNYCDQMREDEDMQHARGK